MFLVEFTKFLQSPKNILKQFPQHPPKISHLSLFFNYFCTRLHPNSVDRANHMKRVGEYRKLLGVTADVTLKELKLIYRNQMKATHPDKFVDDAEGLQLAEENSKTIIEAYHFLCSINPETHQANQEEFTHTTNQVPMTDFYFEKRVLYITHENGIQYEYLGVPQQTFVKMMHSDSASRFAKRHIYGKFLFRKASNAAHV